MSETIPLHDCHPRTGDLLAEVLEGLRARPRRLPPKLFYDARGSELFERITRLPEYYLTRAELEIMNAHAGEMAQRIGARAALIEFGSGASEKTPLLLERLERPTAYVPIDISRDALLASARRIARRFGGLRVLPVHADFDQAVTLPALPAATRRRLVYFPGSTIGNFAPARARAFLARTAELARGQIEPGALLIGFDLRKDPDVLLRAYDDAAGVTAAFNRNALAHIDRLLGADFDPDRFAHVVRWNEEAGRVEMHLEALEAMTVHVGGEAIRFERGDRIWTESSYKYTPEGFDALAVAAGYRPAAHWFDAGHLFCVALYVLTDPEPDP